MMWAMVLCKFALTQNKEIQFNSIQFSFPILYHLEKDLFNSFMRRSLSYRNQSIDLQSKSMDWFLYHRDLRHERVFKEMGFEWFNPLVPNIHLKVTYT